MDRSTPVIVGVSQMNGAGDAREPIDLIARAAERAIADTGAEAFPLDLVALSKIGTHAYWNAPKRLAQRLGQPDARTLQASHGGHTAQVVLCHVAAEIAQGRIAGAIVAGGELGGAMKRRQRGEETAAVEPEAQSVPQLALGDDLSQWLNHPHEIALGIHQPIQLYPLMETALGAALGRTREAHLRATSELWARFSEVAAANPCAVDRRIYDAETLRTAHPGNRYVGFPYTKLMNSDQFVDQAAALVLCSAGTAMDLRIPRDRWVFPWAGVTTHGPFVSERFSLHEAPVLAQAGEALAAMVGRPLRDFELVDLYACFPFAVQAQARALGLDLERPLTLTGGMRFAGGPWNNYGTHQMANVVEQVRRAPDAMAVCSTNGGLATRFCLTAYSGKPAPNGFRTLPYPLVDAGPRRLVATKPEGDGAIEGYTVMHDRSNAPVEGIAACLLPDASRAWAKLREPSDLEALIAADPIGRKVRFASDDARLA